MMKREYMFTYVPDFLTRKWCSDGDKVRILNKDTLEVSTVDYREICREKYIINGQVDEMSPRVLFDEKKLEENLERVENGDYPLLQTMGQDIAALASMLFYSSPVSWWRISRILSEEKEKMKSKKDGKKLDERLNDKLNIPRSGKDLREVMDTAFFMAPYMYDLKPVLLEAPSGSSFVMGYDPLISFNFLMDDIADPSVSFFNNGAVMFITLSSRYAVALYDSFVYRPKKTDGRVILTKEEVLDIDKHLSAMCSDIIFYPDEQLDEEYFINLVKNTKKEDLDIKGFNLPSFRLMSRSYDVQEIETRNYPGLLNMYDMKEKVISFEKRNKAIAELLERERKSRNI